MFQRSGLLLNCSQGLGIPPSNPRVLGFLSAREQGHPSGTYDPNNNGKGSGVSHASLWGGQVGGERAKGQLHCPQLEDTERNTVEGTGEPESLCSWPFK